jgi:hypothetical protein
MRNFFQKRAKIGLKRAGMGLEQGRDKLYRAKTALIGQGKTN